MLRRAVIGLAILLTAAIAAALLIDWEGMVRGYVERTLEARTGRAVDLERVKLHARLPLRIELMGLRIANPDWAQRQPLIGLQAADFTIRLWPLLTRREVVLPSVTLVGPEANLEQREGQRSWVFDREEPAQEDESGPALPQIHALRVSDAVVRFSDPASKTALTILASQSAGGEDGRDRLAFEASGRYRNEQVKLQGSGASLLTLVDRGDPYPLEVQAAVGKTAASFDGEVVNPARLERVAGDLAIKGDNLEHLYRILGITLPATPPYRLKGKLVHEGKVWRLEDFEGGMGDSDLSGDFAFDSGPQPPMLRAQLRSRLLDFDDLGPLVGAPPKTGPGETASAEQRKKAQRVERKPEVVPDEGFKTQRWGTLNAQVSLEAQRIRREKWLPIDRLSARMTLQDKVIELAPLRFGVADGKVDSNIRLDGGQEPLAVRVSTRFNGLQLNRLVPRLQGGRNSTGSLFGNARLAAHGASVKDMTESLDGQVQLTMGPGRVSNLLLEAVGLDAGEIVRLFATGDRIIQLRCAVANLSVEDGIARSDALVIATGDTNVMGTGSIDLGDEKLDLTMYVAPKDMSPVSFRAPLHVRGSFKDPQVRPDLGVLAAKGGAAALLALVNPVLALVPLIETGPGTDSSCGELIQQAEGWREAKDPAARAVRREKQDEGAEAAAAGEAPPAVPRAETMLRDDGGAGRGAGAARPRGPDDAPRAEDVLEKDGGEGR
jgi:uncharacterized protein involved in outer membrane biogenesis